MTMPEYALHDYAALLILNHAQDVLWLTIHEMAEEHVPGGEISDNDALKVADLIAQATVRVTWKKRPGLFYDNRPATVDETETGKTGETGP